MTRLQEGPWLEVEGRRFRVVVEEGDLDTYVEVGLEADPPYEGRAPVLYATAVQKRPKLATEGRR